MDRNNIYIIPQNSPVKVDLEDHLTSPINGDLDNYENIKLNSTTDKKHENMPDIPENEPQMHHFCGELYRKLCFSKLGIRFLICLNICMILINSFLVLFELYNYIFISVSSKKKK